ncbi:Protein CBR-RME-8, isoform b [Caenorhabditis briggsae]|uniref:Protein CBR-RME-8, isoform b n=1 Tax=Caenorhabditis briggsae TaxID=6238 RepID=H8WH50_CAEBR|nr:Protein CBR-RME-8, isoform b [Caenorhabditis briggsae]CCG58567.1 Protein CBR-RME-8, isoform b [Caenorhabditis briggsae]
MKIKYFSENKSEVKDNASENLKIECKCQTERNGQSVLYGESRCRVLLGHQTLMEGKIQTGFLDRNAGITTYNPNSLEITNQWLYEDFISVKPFQPNDTRQEETGFKIWYRQRGKKDDMKFSSEYTPDILTHCLQFHTKFADKVFDPVTVTAFKQSWSDRRIQVTLRANAFGLEQIDNRGVVVQMYPYKNIRSIGKISDCPGAFVVDVGEHRRRHMFASSNQEELIKECRRLAIENIGYTIPMAKELISLDDFLKTRLGLCSRDEELTSYSEFKVSKITRRAELPVRRLLCLSETCIIERDLATYAVICATPLKHIVCLVRSEKDPQQFIVEYENGDGRAYVAAERDLILASLLDGIRASGNQEVFVCGHRFERNLRVIPFSTTLDEDAESQCMKHIIAPPPGLRRCDTIRRFNANVPYSGLRFSKSHEGFFSENKGKVIVNAIEAVLGENYTKEEKEYKHKTEAQLQCLRRLFASKSGFQAFTEVTGVREKLGSLVVRVLSWKSESIDHSTVEALCALMYPMHDQYELRIEQLNKQSLMSSPKFVENLLDLIVLHVDRSTGWLVIASMLNFLTFSVCSPYSETTSGDTFDHILKLVALRGRSFFRLFQCPSMTIVKGAGMVMRAIIEEADVETSKSMQMLALSEGAFLTHLHTALLTVGKDLRRMTNKQLSGHLISLWIADNQQANDLLVRCLPRGLLNFMESDEKVPISEKDLLIPRNNLSAATNESKQNTVKEKLDHLRIVQHWDLEQKLNFLPKRVIDEKQQQRQQPVVLRKRRNRVRPNVNWRLFAYQFSKDHSQADLIWNEKTREEFRHSMENEERTLASEKEQAPTGLPIAWNHTEFQIRYPSLLEEIKIGDYYLRLLLIEADENATPIHNPLEFFNNVYHRFLLSTKTDMKCLCLRAMSITYSRHHMTIGPFQDAKYFVEMLQKCANPLERDHLVLLLSKLALNKDNVRELIIANVLPLLVDLCVLAHLHVQRAKVQNQTNVIEASAEQMAEGGSEEWYYHDKEAKQVGPLSFEKMKTLFVEKTVFEKTQIWAAGMDKWMSLAAVPQFRWTVCQMAKDIPQEINVGKGPFQATQMNFTDLSVLCLDTILQMCEFFPSRDSYDCVVRPMPSVKKQLTEPVLLYQLVQLLLTYEPQIVQRVASLLYLVMQDNPFLPRLYLSGVFYFILMYNGSNVLPIARFLHYTHMKQAYRSTLPHLESTRQSILATLLPEAATFYLEQYGPEKYAEVFLGEFDNPEIIWNTAMRRHLIERIAVHVADFSHRLTSNVRALYQFCPIPLIDYPELTQELFCHVYYLRHLCNRQRFPDWPIRDPIPFLRSCLATWYNELEKKPSTMSADLAREILSVDLSNEEHRKPAFIRRQYYKLAAKYHPDKNPEGREMFERINAAYELLSSESANNSTMPDSHRIVLCLQAQSIIYSRYSQELSEYKYAGYSQLIKTINLEAKDDALFIKGGGDLLSAAIELANYTLISSALNAEQLRRDGGLEALVTAFDRCVPMVTMSSTPDDMPVQVCIHVCDCFATASTFEMCRQKLAEMVSIFGALTRLLQFSHLPRLSTAAAQCICAMSVDELLQFQLFQTGVLWQLVPHLFHYDYTLDEGGVQHSEDSNKQSLANSLARSSSEALAALAGYRENTPDNEGVQKSLRALLTPYICRCMRVETNDMVLKTLNSNLENPYMIWDNGTRAEVLEFVEKHRTSNEPSSTLMGAEFELSVHKNELIVGDVFIRIYNEQPTFALHEPKKVAVDLLDYIRKSSDELNGVPKPIKKNPDDLIEIDWGNGPSSSQENGNTLNTETKVLMVMTALSNLVSANPGVEILLIGNFPLLITYLRGRKHPQLQIAALQVILLAAANKECVTDLATCNITTTLFTLLKDHPKIVARVLDVLIALSSNGQIVKEMLEHGGLMYILSILCLTNSDQGQRLQSAELLAKLQADKLTGPRWTRFINKFLPAIFADALRDSPNTASVAPPTLELNFLGSMRQKLRKLAIVFQKWAEPNLNDRSPTFCRLQMFDSSNEHPELIWNENTRKKVKEIIDKEVETLYQKHIKDPTAKWNTTTLSDDYCAYGDSISGELVVGGVFIRLFVENPGWPVRHPKEFARELIEKVLELMARPPPQIEMVTTAFRGTATGSRISATVLYEYGQSEARSVQSGHFDPSGAQRDQFCCDALSQLPCIDGIMKSMKNQPSLMRESAHALKCLMKRNTGELAQQMLNCGMVPYLLEVLDSSMNGVSNGAAARAEIVDALKSAILDLKVGTKIQEILEKSPIWAQFKDQRHDLFLPAARTLAVTGAPTGVAGYLTEGMFNPPPMSNQPPPMHHDAAGDSFQPPL